MGDQIRVLFFHVGSDVFGGGSKMLLRLLKSLDKDLFEPVLLSNTIDELSKRARDCGIKVNIVPFRGALDTYNRQLLSNSYLLPSAGFRILQFNSKVYSHLRGADILWCKNLRAVLTLLPYLSLTRTPTVWNIGLGLESSGKVKYLNSVALRVVDHIFIESKEQANRIFTPRQYNRYVGKFTIFHKGIDTNRFDPKRFEEDQERDCFRIGTAASFTPRKGLEYLIDALPMVLEETKNVKLSIAGDAPEGNKKYEQSLKERIQMHNIDDHVEFLGWVEDMPAYLSRLDVLVHPSLNEGIPGVVREALAMETPVVATDVGGTSDVVINGKTGLLVNPEDSTAIKNAINYLLEHPEVARQMGANGRIHIADSFSLNSYVDKYERFLKNGVKE